MSSDYNGMPGNELTRALTAIASSTNASPIVVTTNVAHGLLQGEEVIVRDHQTNTGANGIWQVNVLNTTQVELWTKVNSAGLSGASTGTGVGGATGTLCGTGFRIPYVEPDDGDLAAPTAAMINTPSEAANDRSHFIMSKMGLYRVVWESITVVNDLASATSSNTYGSGVALDTTWRRQGLVGPLSLDFFSGTYPDVTTTDVIECEFRSQGDSSVAATLLGIGVEYFDPGAGPSVVVDGACTKVPGSTTLLQYVAASGFDRQQTIVRARFFPLFGGSFNLFKKMQLYVAARTLAGTNSGYAFHDDLQWNVRILRNTLLVV